ncbi:peptide chain release factor 1 [Haladaptatus paucihalophilus DX253]|uniref:Peptide chain release factor 1 n=1 Tax=Haladaptatus paucihalophilus DX253 TaxID=797209 RepID=E7QWQ2_HALPU|nr:peptide chain release factor aRF-1 [Haladaptatus paucihalophilus]EFW91148.1 peptide chain release factor 1 [Haladaptatus paucihalophilus DX253]SHL35848.1 peptide chain release factor subunit 1 [Haladaptatus paucihalophilus DX253]
MSQTYDLRDQIEHLESLTGDGTELVTVTVPNSKSLGSIRERIAQEYASAENIKSDQTRDHVQQALKRVQRILRRYETTPESGLVVYAGIVDGDLISTAFDDLPAPVTESTYRCDDHFDLTPLVEAVTPNETFGLIVIERGGAAIGRLVGERIIPIRTFESQVMGKSRAGGQSAQRFERDRERQVHEFFQQVGDIATEAFTGDEGTVTSLVVGGTLATAKRFVSDGYLDHRLRNRLLGTYSVEYATVQGLDQLVEKADKQLLDAEQREGRERLDEFYSRLRAGELVAYGTEEVERAIEFGAVESVLIASTVSRDHRGELETAVEQQGGDGYVIDSDTERGSQFVAAFSGVGALLRFPVK